MTDLEKRARELADTIFYVKEEGTVPEVILEALRTTRNEALEEAAGDIRFLLSFVPKWAKEVPGGLDATMYGTGSAAGDVEVKHRVDKIRAAYAEREAFAAGYRAGKTLRLYPDKAYADWQKGRDE